MMVKSRSTPKGPIFVIGCPRSGNTLLGAILNKHPELLILFEANTFSALYRKWMYRCRSEKGTAAEQFSRIMIETFSHYNTQFHISEEDIAECAHSGAPHWGKMLDCYMRLLMSRAKPTAIRWGDKTPHHVGNIVQILQNYPDAQFIYSEKISWILFLMQKYPSIRDIVRWLAQWK